MRTPDDILEFWLEDVGPDGWYINNSALDTRITDGFLKTWQDAREGACGLWLMDAKGTMAYIILTDQFSRNMFRGQADAFATDPNARAASKMAIENDWDLQFSEPERQFFYMPLMHSENLVDQDHAIAIIAQRMPETGANILLHARAHRQIIETFGRFPFRNDALGRTTTDAEAVFMEQGAYGAVLRDLKAQND